ncbi:MAG TPA: BamA/TamA family outer membrane protein [Vicinamibacterales bacterium]|nr:BamA/TamA family outer membrane protein [Vicinamibacterales bacterium]
MERQSINVALAEVHGHTARVETIAADGRGWEVTAWLDDRVVVTRHCGDWHRVERARMEAAMALRDLGRRFLEVSALLAFLIGCLPNAGLAQQRPTHDSAPAAAAETVSAPVAVFPEPRVIARGIDAASRMLGDGSEVKNGFYPELSNMPTGAGWISVGPGYRQWWFGDQMFLDASTAISWRSYKMAQARFELPHLAQSRLAVGTQVRWQDLTQVTFFGEGADSLESNRSEYRLKSTNVAAYATVRARQWLSIGGRVGWLDRPSLTTPAGTFKRGNPATQELFPDEAVFTVSQQPSYGYREASLTIDTRDHRSHPTAGGMYRVAWSGYSDQDAGAFSFRRSEAEAAQFVPLARSRLVLAMHGWLVASQTADDESVPLYLEPSLGGHNTLRGYSDFRFHDRNLLVVNLEARLALFRHVDAVVFADAGNVAPRVSDLNVDKRSYGVGWRMHSRESTFARLDVARGDEGWKFLFRLSDPLHFSRLSRRTAPLPFAP